MVKLLFILLLPLQLIAQDPAVERRIMRKHPNGKEHVVLYFNIESGALLKEEVMYLNGKMEWTGGYKNKKEDGLWQFYWNNGKPKLSEYYLNGKEHGTTTEFNKEGKKIKESYWKHGRMVKEVKF